MRDALWEGLQRAVSRIPGIHLVGSAGYIGIDKYCVGWLGHKWMIRFGSSALSKYGRQTHLQRDLED